jgi:hypothetical protein
MTAWIPVTEYARLSGLDERRVREMASNGKLPARREVIGKCGRALLVALPPALHAKHLSENPAVAAVQGAMMIATGSREQFDAAPVAIKERALQRLELVRDYIAAIARGESDSDWLAQRIDAGAEVSLKSVHRWTRRCNERGLDGLIDHNDGSAKRGKFSIPIEARNFFYERYLDGTSPTIKRAIEDTRLAAIEYGWKLPKRDDPFYRFEKTIAKAVKSARRENIDKPSAVMPFVQRGMDVPYRTLQSDHHIADVFVHCEGTICGSEPCRAHRPWWTPMFDVGSRKIVSYKISLEVPNAQRILDAFRAAVAAEGLPERFYCDNGKDFKKAAEWKGGLSRDDQEFVGRRFKTLGIEVVFAKPYNAQAKAIERLFGTFVKRWWQGSPSYTGALGKRTERVQYICKNPELLPTFTQFVEALDAQITIYNTTPHRGTGMRGRTPAQAFREERIPMRRPHESALALVFWRCEERVVDRAGVRIDNVFYRISDIGVQVRYQGQRVKVLVNPDDISQALVVSPADELLSPAIAAPFATHDTRDAVTQSEMEAARKRTSALNREFRRSGSASARSDLRFIKANLPDLLKKSAAARREEEEQLVAAAGQMVASTVVIPRFSKIDRDLTRRADGYELTAADREAAASIPPLTEERLDQLLADFGRSHPAPNGSLRLVGSSEASTDEDRAAVEIERERLRLNRLRHAGLCVACALQSVTRALPEETELCGRCWLDIHADELDEGALQGLLAAIEEEEGKR